MSKSLKRVTQSLEAMGFRAEIVGFETPVKTAQAAAEALGVETDQIAKSIIFEGAESGRIYLFVTAGGRQVCLERAAALAGEPLIRADASKVRKHTGFAIGGVAPLGHLNTTPVFMDNALDGFDVVWAAAGTPHHVFAAPPIALAEATGATCSDFSEAV